MQNTTLPSTPDTPWALSKNVLNEAGLLGDIHLLSPGAEKSVAQASSGALVFFVITGPVTIASGAKNYILQSEDTLHLPEGSKYVVRNVDATPAKVLVLALPQPPRPVRLVFDPLAIRG